MPRGVTEVRISRVDFSGVSSNNLLFPPSFFWGVFLGFRFSQVSASLRFVPFSSFWGMRLEGRVLGNLICLVRGVCGVIHE